MIYTVTLNPALDYVVQVESFEVGKINRTKEEHLFYGGKGINVSWILKELEVKSCTLGFIASFTGDALKEGLEKQGLETDFIKVQKGMTRINVKLKSNEETEINGSGPLIEAEDFTRLKQQLSLLHEEDWLVLSGSVPSCLDSNAYEQLIEVLPKNVKIVVDAQKDLLLKVLNYKPFLIKPNHLELAEIFHIEMQSDADIIYYAKELQKRGAQNVLVSMADKGAILVDHLGNVHKQKAASGKVVNSVGAGDSMVAGFIAGYLKYQDYKKALKLGTACGGGTAFHFGLASREQIEEVLEQLQGDL